MSIFSKFDIMKDEVGDSTDFLQNISDKIHYFVQDHISYNSVVICQVIFKFIFIAVFIYALDFILKSLVNKILKYFFDKEKYAILKSIYQSRITNSIIHLLALAVTGPAMKSIFLMYPKSFDILRLVVSLAAIFVIGEILFRTLATMKNYFVIKQEYYKVITLNAISESVKIFGVVILIIVGTCLLLGIKGETILGGLGAVTAVLVLVFKDVMLGFITGIHIATSKNMKIGDWIAIPKYNIEGTIADIRLLTTKINNFDKTVSTIPTYDLLTTEIKNLQFLSESNSRRIKKSIYFNINSFRFLSDEKIERLKDINLISEYLHEKCIEIEIEKEKLAHKDKIINGRQLTNIGVFRYYAQQYIENNRNVDKSMIMVRQLDITPNGLPLEIYCFAIDAKWERFEQIQADIFDHLLVASKDFDLQVMQETVKA